jgi:hypothetical protein
MKTFVQFLIRNENGAVEPIKGKNDIKIIDERKNRTAQVNEAFTLCEKHEQTAEIVGFNIVEVDAFRNKENIEINHIF